MCCQETAEPLATASRKIVPADDAVLDEPLARFRHFLFFFLRLQKLARIAHRDGAREAVRVLNAIQLLFESPVSAPDRQSGGE